MWKRRARDKNSPPYERVKLRAHTPWWMRWKLTCFQRQLIDKRDWIFKQVRGKRRTTRCNYFAAAGRLASSEVKTGDGEIEREVCHHWQWLIRVLKPGIIHRGAKQRQRAAITVNASNRSWQSRHSGKPGRKKSPQSRQELSPILFKDRCISGKDISSSNDGSNEFSEDVITGEGGKKSQDFYFFPHYPQQAGGS